MHNQERLRHAHLQIPDIADLLLRLILPNESLRVAL